MASSLGIMPFSNFHFGLSQRRDKNFHCQLTPAFAKFTPVGCGLLDHGRSSIALQCWKVSSSSTSVWPGKHVRRRAYVQPQYTTELPTFSHAEFEDFLVDMQDTICATAAEADGSGRIFCEDRWQREEDPSAGYGITRVMEDGDLLEKAAVNVSIVKGPLSESRAKAMSARGRDVENGAPYFAGALSLVFHSRSPYVPTFRSDVRYFEVQGGGGWFGGGADLTPSYLFEEDVRFFHKYYKEVCDKHDPTKQLYLDFKRTCDEYFYIPARKEYRGTGGIFFDDLESMGYASTAEEDRSRVFGFVKDVAQGFMPSYLPIAQLRRKLPYSDRERQWQLLRRGRYLEFNLLYDRGVKFGLEGGRMESIMVSAPPLIAWKYNAVPHVDTPEHKLLQVLRKPSAWV